MFRTNPNGYSHVLHHTRILSKIPCLLGLHVLLAFSFLFADRIPQVDCTVPEACICGRSYRRQPPSTHQSTSNCGQSLPTTTTTTTTHYLHHHHQVLLFLFTRRLVAMASDTLASPGAANTILACANTSTHCPNEAKLICSGCNLIKYCSKTCQRAHWALHKIVCRSPMAKENWVPTWVTSNRLPAFIVPGPAVAFGVNSYLWGNMPSFDHINLLKNEGCDWGKPLDLCFAASGDLRNVIASVNSLPIGFTEPCNIVLNDCDRSVVLRNLLLLFTFSSFPPSEAAELGLHLWYSAKLTVSAQTKLRKTFQDKLEKIRVHLEKAPHLPDENLLSTTFSLGEKAKMNCVLPREYWKQLFEMLNMRMSSDRATQNRHFVTMNASRLDFRERHLCILRPCYRLSKQQYYEDGLLLPFGADRRGFTEPNFTLFDVETGMWMLMDSADPFNSWNYADAMKSSEKLGLPKNDIFGALFVHVLPHLEEFSRRLQTGDLKFTLLSVDARKMESALLASAAKHGIRAFDRIDVSNIVDRCYVGAHDTLELLGRLLKTRTENPHACLISLFMNYHEDPETAMLVRSEADKEAAAREAMRLIAPATPPRGPLDPVFVKLMDWTDYFQDWDRTWEIYSRAHSIDAAAGSTGMVPRTVPKVIANTPYAINKSAGKRKLLEQFQAYDIVGLRGHERYIEWERAN
ncbi:hypothetical protein FN846DRAFT_962716 [Sphaerosporella brunnea]|uniref:MYND-type domain-containing protein n=1 Tax=Sphaerosporella brunnea TaxID=1250544 RepID=A0A5J5EMR5_9PEZI|nr:hypothetical protein FN846DRAFT_962716 [Sphaerosporella brunnea]